VAVRSKLKNFLDNMQIRKKLLSISFISGIIPMLVLSIFLISSMRNLLMDRALQTAEDNSRRITAMLEETLRTSIKISDWIYIDESLQQIAQKKYTNPLELIEDYSNYTRFDELLLAYDEIDSIRFYIDNPTLISNSYLNRLSERDKETSWYRKAIINHGKTEFIQRYDDISRDTFLALVRGVYTLYGDLIGVLVVNLSDKLADTLEDQSVVSLIAIDSGVIQFASDEDYIGKSLFTVEGMEDFGEGEESRVMYVPFLQERALISQNIISPMKSKTPFYVVNMVPLSEILQETNQTLLTSSGIILISLIFSLSLSLLFSFGFSKRIEFLRKEMHQVALSQFNLSGQIEGNDEVGQLYSDLKIMVASLQKLIHEVYEQKLIQEKLNRQQREVEFKMLTSQINPHFLYNTLETIRMKILISGQRDVATIVKKVSHIMRRNLGVKNSLVSLQEELDCVRDYLEIQRFRYGDKFDFQFDIQCPIDQYFILPLLIQPVVENAFIHGLENKEEKGHIKLEVYKQKPQLYIKISDDGVGIEEEKLKKMQYAMRNRQQGALGIGMSNVNQRIHLYYGEDAGMDIESETGKGTTLILRLPEDVRKEDLDV